MTRGSLIRVNLEDGQPHEFGKIGPAIVLSNDEANAVLPTVVVVPLSTRPPQIWPLRIQVPDLPGLRQSYAVVPGIRQVSKARITEHLGDVPVAFLRALESACSAYLGD